MEFEHARAGWPTRPLSQIIGLDTTRSVAANSPRACVVFSALEALLKCIDPVGSAPERPAPHIRLSCNTA